MNDLSDDVFDFGLRLKKLRQEAKLTQRYVARRLGVTTAMIQKYESNNALPPVDKLETMAIIYRVSLDYLRNLDKRNKRAGIYLDDLPLAQQILIKSVVEELKKELAAYDKNR